MKISATNFKKKYLYLEKSCVDKSLSDFINVYEDERKLKDSLRIIFPYLEDKDANIFINYITNTYVEYSNRLNLKLNKSLFNDYVDTLQNEKIRVDLVRLNFTKNFIYHCGGKIKKYSKIHLINTEDLDYINENGIYFYNYGQVSNKKKFINNILDSDSFFKYLLHQDIHNSILNPVLVSIMLSKYFANKSDKDNKHPTMIQLRDIRQIYKHANKDKTKIEMIYFIKKYFVLDQNISDTPIEKYINPYLIIHCEMTIKKDDIYINMTY